MTPANDSDRMESRSPDRHAVGSVSGLKGDDPGEVAQELFDWSQELVGIEGAIFFLIDEEELVARFGFEVSPTSFRELRLSMADEGPIQGSVTQNVTRVFTGEVEFRPGTPFPWAVSICVPLTIADTAIGAYVAGWSGFNDFDTKTRLVLEGAASMAASSVHRAQLLYEVKREQHRLNTLLDRMPIPAVGYSLSDFTLNHVNAEARKLIGDVRGEPVWDTAVKFVGDRSDGSSASEEEVLEALVSPTRVSRFQMRTIDGTIRTIFPHIARLGPSSGVIMLIDVTHETDLEMHRKRFVRMISHQLRTPLTPLMGFAEFVAASVSEDPAVQEAATEISAAVRDMTGQIQRLEQIADLQPLDEGALDPISVMTLVSSAWEAAGGGAEELSVKGDLHAQVLCKPDFVSKAMAEVFANAYVHGQPPVEATVSAGETEVIVSVRDSGTGISPEWESAVFSPYLTAEGGYAAPQGGQLGLGLTLARALMEATRGQLSYDNGAFVFVFPS